MDKLKESILEIFTPECHLIMSEIIKRLGMKEYSVYEYSRIHRAISSLWLDGKLLAKLDKGKRRYYLP